MVYLVVALFIMVAVEAYIIGCQSFRLDQLSDKYLEAIQEFEPIDAVWRPYNE